MSKKKLSSEVIETYNTDIVNVATEIDTHYASVEKLASKIDTLVGECELAVKGTLSDEISATMSAATLTVKLDDHVSNIKTALTSAEEKAQTDDQVIKESITARSDEVKQLKNIIDQYKGQIQSASSLTAPGLASGLRAIGRAGNIDKIPGVVDGRNKRLESDVKSNKLLTKEQIIEKIKELYQNLTDEELEILAEYYTFRNMKSWPISTQPLDVIGKDAILLFEDGKYKLVYMDKSKINVLDIKGSASVDGLNPSLSSDIDINGQGNPSVKSGISSEISGEGNILSVENGQTSWNVGNVSAKASIDKDGAEFVLGGSVAKGTYKVTFWEDDLHIVTAEVDVSFLSREIKAKLGRDGFGIETPGLIGIGVSGNKKERIDLDVGL